MKVCLAAVAVACCLASSAFAFGLDDPFRSGCVFNVGGDDDQAESDFRTLEGNLSAEVIRGRDCVLVFRDLGRGHIRIQFKAPARPSKTINKMTPKDEEKQQSCGTSFVKIYDVETTPEAASTLSPLHANHEADKGQPRKRKVGHFCNSLLKDREVSFEFNGRLEVVLIQTRFDIFYDYNATEEVDYKSTAFVAPRWVDDSNKTSNLDKAASKSKPIFLEKIECDRQLKFACKYSVVCGVAGSKFLCNKTKYLCIDLDDVCNDVNDCLDGDNSDESRCYFPFIKTVSFVLMTVGICCATAVCSLHHRASLRKNNVVRYKGDVIKRKDIIKAKKHGGFAAVVDTLHASVERKTSLMLNNPSLTPVDTEEKPISGKVVAADSQEHSDAKKSALTQLSVNNLKLVDKIEEPLQPDPTAVTDNGVVTSAKILYDYSISDDEDMAIDGRHSAAGGGYGYRFEFQNFR